MRLLTVVSFASLILFAITAMTPFASAQGFYLNKPLNGGAVRPRFQMSEEARERLGATIVSHTLSIVYARHACADLAPDACLDHSANLEASHRPQYAQVSLEKWDLATQEITQALNRIKQSASSPTEKFLNEKPEVWKLLFNVSILVRLTVGKFAEEVKQNPEANIPNQLRNLRAQKHMDRLEIHHQLVFLGEKVFIGHKAVDRTGDDFKAHRLISQMPLSEVDLRETDQLGELVVTRIKSSMVHFGQALSN